VTLTFLAFGQSVATVKIAFENWSNILVPLELVASGIVRIEDGRSPGRNQTVPAWHADANDLMANSNTTSPVLHRETVEDGLVVVKNPWTVDASGKTRRVK
jgi:hypothetical protein